MKKMQSDLNLSDRQAIGVGRYTRHFNRNRNIIEKGFQKSLPADKKIFDDFFTCRFEIFENKKGEEISKPFVFCHDLDGFIEKICEYRNIHKFETKYKLGIDKGKKRLKVTLTMYEPGDTIPTKSKRRSYSDSPGGAERFKFTGIKKSFIIAIANKTPETYSNCKKIFDFLDINNMPSYVVSADMKLHNIMLGLQSHSSAHPCGYCLQPAGFKDTSDYPLRTIEGIISSNAAWIEYSLNRKDLKHFENCEHVPILKSSAEEIFTNSNSEAGTLVLSILPPPSLHLILGIFNKIYSELENLEPKVSQWSKRLNCSKTDYNDHGFEGNECRKLMKNLPALDEILESNLVHFLMH